MMSSIHISNINLPFLDSCSVLFLGNTPDGYAEHYLKEQYESLRLDFDRHGYRLVYLPELFEDMVPEVLHYCLPGISSEELNDRTVNDRLLEQVAASSQKGEPCSGFLYSKSGEHMFHTLSEDRNTVPKDITDFIESLPQQDFLIIEDTTFPACSHYDYNQSCLEINCTHEDTLEDSKTEAILNEIERIQHEYGISLEDLDRILNSSVRLSRITITPQNRIYLSDYGNKEIRMDHLSKAVYFLYLRHPNGIRYKDLSDYHKELLDIYLKITGRDSMDEIRKSIDDIVNPLSNAINVKVSRIKAAFRSAVCDRIARHYYVDGTGGSPKKVTLDRSLIIWQQ